jgi:hypothetical protein
VPAAAVTPAPIAYIKFAAVKKLVVELGSLLAGPSLRRVTGAISGGFHRCLGRRAWPSLVGSDDLGVFTLKKVECSKQAFCAGIH